MEDRYSSFGGKTRRSLTLSIRRLVLVLLLLLLLGVGAITRPAALPTHGELPFAFDSDLLPMISDFLPSSPLPLIVPPLLGGPPQQQKERTTNNLYDDECGDSSG